MSAADKKASPPEPPKMASAAAAMMNPDAAPAGESRYRVAAPPPPRRKPPATLPPLPGPASGTEAPAAAVPDEAPAPRPTPLGPRLAQPRTVLPFTARATQGDDAVSGNEVLLDTVWSDSDLVGPTVRPHIPDDTGPVVDASPPTTKPADAPSTTEPRDAAPPKSPTVSHIPAPTDTFGRGRNRTVTVDEHGNPLPRTGRIATSVSLPPVVRAAWFSYAKDAGFSKNEVLLDAFEFCHDNVADLVSADNVRQQPKAGALFLRGDRPGEKGEEANVVTGLRIQARHLNVIDSMLETSGALNRSQLVSVVLERFLQEQGAL